MLGFIGVFLIMLGAILLRKKLTVGWLALLFADLCWVGVGIQASDWTIWAAQAALVPFHVWGYLDWRRDARS
jgi:hypothetical protein